ncbi:MAG: hypothetical protein Q8K43_00825, partial [Sulfurimicrobium sp.]|nr:hypothetical protein [Sulfurimicrobium sp.]
MSQATRIYFYSVLMAVSIVMVFFTIQTVFIEKIFHAQKVIVPLSLGCVLGLLVGSVQVLRARLAERNRLFSALADFALEFTYFRKISGEYEYVSP